MRDIYSPPDQVLETQPEELGAFLLEHLAEIEAANGANQMHLGNYFGSAEVDRFRGSIDARQWIRVITEAWVWLEREGLIAPLVEKGRDWVFVTRRGENLLAEQNREAFHRGQFLQSVVVQGFIVRKVEPPSGTGRGTVGEVR